MSHAGQMHSAESIERMPYIRIFPSFEFGLNWGKTHNLIRLSTSHHNCWLTRQQVSCHTTSLAQTPALLPFFLLTTSAACLDLLSPCGSLAINPSTQTLHSILFGELQSQPGQQSLFGSCGTNTSKIQFLREGIYCKYSMSLS